MRRPLLAGRDHVATGQRGRTRPKNRGRGRAAGRPRLGVEGAVLAEAQIVAPRIDDVERTLAPRASDYCASWFAMDVIRREYAEPFRPRVHSIDVVDGEEQRLRSGRRRNTAVRDVEDGDGHAAIEVVTRARVTLAA